MVKHIILWQLKDEYSDAKKADIKAGIKAGLEGLAGQIPGLVEVHVNINVHGNQLPEAVRYPEHFCLQIPDPVAG